MSTGGFSEMLFIFVLALVIFGPKRLPEIARQIGKALAEFRRASNEFKSQLESEMRQLEIEESLRKVTETTSLPPVEGTLGHEASPASLPAAALEEPQMTTPDIALKSEAAQGPNA